ncbi:hypothetical protein ACWEAF_05925 [Streptomyces sp. NPDC005071]
MSDRKPLNCSLCGLAIWNWTPTVWSSSEPREPFCGPDCLATATAITHSIPPAIDRATRRDHSLCGEYACSDCR